MAAQKTRPPKATTPGTTAARPHWSSAYLLLPGAKKAKAARVKTAESLASEAARMPDSFMLSWKATTEGLLDELELRFAPEYYLAHERSGGALVVYRENDDGTRESRRIAGKKPDEALIIATVAALAGQVVLSLVPVNDGDDLHYVFVDPELIPKLKKLLGSDYTTAFEELPAAPIERAAKR